MDLDKLLAPRADTASGLPEDDVDVPGVGTVRVRGLSRLEVMNAQKIDDPTARETRMLTLGMVDPVMSEAQALQWQTVSAAGEIEPVTDCIAELSGMRPDSSKSGLPGAGDGSGAGV